MNRELKAYKMTERIVTESNNLISFNDAIRKTRSYYTKKKFWWGWGTHVGDNYMQRLIMEKLLQEKGSGIS